MKNTIHAILSRKASSGLFSGNEKLFRRIGLAVGLGMLAVFGARAQAVSTYRLTPSTGTFTPITGGTAIPALLCDDCNSPSLPIGFTFRYGGVDYTSFIANANGYLYFNGSTSTRIDAIYSDLDGRTSGATPAYVLTGSAPNRVLTMEWLNWGNYSFVANVVSFQIKLYEGSNRIALTYRREATPANQTFDIGLYDNAGTLILRDAGPNPTTASGYYNGTLPLPATNQIYTFMAGNVWTGAVSTAWNVAGNWADGVVPTATTNAVVVATANQPVVTGAQSCAYFSVNSGATLTLAANAVLTASNTANLTSASTLEQQAGSELRIGQDLTNAGATFTLDPTSLVSFRAATATTHILTGTGTMPFQNLNLGQQAASDQLSIQGTTTVQRLMTLAQASTATVAAGGSLTLLSNATGTGQIAQDANSTVTGTVSVQRYITPTLNAGAGYRHYSAPITNATTASLATAGFTPTFNTAYNSAALPNMVTPFPTVLGYDQARVGTVVSPYGPFDVGFLSPTAGDALTAGKGYTVNIPASQTVVFTGLLSNGTVSLSGLTRGTDAQSGWQLVGNPYASVLDMDVVTAASTGLDNAVYVYQSTGQYAGSYQTYVRGVGTAHYVASGQGFFMRTTSAATPGVLVISNAARLATYASTTFQRTTAETRPLVQLDLVNSANQQRDAAYVYFEAGATAGFDSGFDAFKLPSGNFPSVAVTASVQNLSISGLPVLGTADVLLPLTVAVPTTGTYTLDGTRVINLPVGKIVYLRDAQTGAAIDLGQTPSYSFTMNAAFTGPRFSLFITSNRVLATAPASLTQQVALYPSPAAKGTAVLLELPTALRQQAISIALVNSLGQLVKTVQLPATTSAAPQTLSLTGVAAGVYSVCLTTSQGLVTKRLVVE